VAGFGSAVLDVVLVVAVVETDVVGGIVVVAVVVRVAGVAGVAGVTSSPPASRNSLTEKLIGVPVARHAALRVPYVVFIFSLSLTAMHCAILTTQLPPLLHSCGWGLVRLEYRGSTQMIRTQ